MSTFDLIDSAYAERRSEQIIGNSPALKSALAIVERVAPTNATVLILGETGTGKELIARTIHDLSPRSGRPFVKLDCASIRFDLLESELFGHEKGAFIGAIAQKIGCFDIADTGTLFLDEIGDFPLALQPKLLRILQEQEFERPGSGETHRVDVRLVAATNRDLKAMIERGEFRSDLYYRLNGFPITLPPLRERGKDIALLVSHFVEMFSKCMGKRIHHIPEETLRVFTAHSWPGNVRELRNLIERAVILSDDGELRHPLPISERYSTATPSHGRSNGSQQALIQLNDDSLRDPTPISHRHSEKGPHASGHELGSSDTSRDAPIVFVVDDDVSVRESMELLIRNEGWQAETFAYAKDFINRPRPIVPNCLVLDVSLQDVSGLDLQKKIAFERSETPIIFITGFGDVPTSVQAMKAGAVEFLTKPFNDEALLNAIREGLKRSSMALRRESEMRPLRDCYASLSHREKQVMALVASGLLNKQIGAELGISEITVKAHRGRVMQKMGASSVVDLIRMATRLRSDRSSLASVQLRLPSPSTANAAQSS